MTDLPGNLGGKHPLNAWLNQLKLAIRARTPLSGPGYQLKQTPGGFILVPQATAAPTPLRTYRVKSVAADDAGRGNVLVCRTWDGTTEGATDIYVAKDFACQQPAGETIDGVVFAYTYAGAVTTLNRTRTTAPNAETQQVTPLWQVNGLIKVAAISFSGVTKAGADLKLIESGPRCWAWVG